LKVEKEYVYRDMFFYLLSLVILGVFIFMGELNAIAGVLLISVYVGYIIFLHRQTIAHRKALGEAADADEDDDEESEDMSYTSIIFWLITTMAIIWFSVDAIIASAGVIADFLSIPKFITSVIIIAAATSIPDTMLSVKSAKKGDADAAISNAVGSNIFDICICLGLPMIIAGKPIPISISGNLGMLFFLIASMSVTGFILLKKSGVKIKDAKVMLVTYVAFLCYVSGIAFGFWK